MTTTKDYHDELPTRSAGASGAEDSEGCGSDYVDDESGHLGNATALEEKPAQKIAQKESDQVWYLRLVLLMVLVVAALTTSLLLYFLLRADEQEDFEKQYYSDVNKILEGIASSIDNSLGAIDAYVSKMVAQQSVTNSSFPFVTVPGFGVQAAKLMKLSGAYQFGTALFVTPEQRDPWQKYASENDQWVEETIQVQDKNEEWLSATLRNYNASYELIGITAEMELGVADDPLPYSNNTYAALWQNAPLLEEQSFIPYNYDVWISVDAVPDILESIHSQRVIIAKSPNILMDPDDAEMAIYIEELAEKNKHFVSPDQDPTEPITAITYPIIDSFDSVRIDVSPENLIHNTVVGFLFFTIYFRELFINILPDNSIGLVVVVEAPDCNETFTYRLDGPEAIYLGGGDHHDPSYDYLEQSAQFAEMMETAKSQGSSSYTGLPLSDTYCARNVRIYPSKATEDPHTTNKPVIIAVLTALIFVFTSLIFLLFDWRVRVRQTKVNNRAVASTAIVTSLFPEQVAQQLYQEREETIQHKKAKETNLDSFLQEDHYHGSTAVKSSKPIASRYDHTSILFMDLSGFTFWSAQRGPEDVFLMLETFYGAIDEIAKKRGVFKVETIGDCYVAVTGIPDAMEDHAATLCRFARDSVNKMNELKVQLAETVGPDILDLQFRVGIHSGSCIAGVLRGEKGRFQLFGNTMNFAARMESTGVPGRIHVSEATAEELRSKGKGHWLEPREDLVHAKGLGEIQTYFVDFKNAKSIVSCSVSNWSNDRDQEDRKDLEDDDGAEKRVSC
ncbi:stable enterotoxin receptor [Seminavis robusta]|uniref:Stable enterotoxin receptor n=1 Tax=Seminavis robusta TaxID=568900 RepID=A0A9N8HUJ2_9STRA|nr:stable enterotoxin receptor [Seminavis robusta]|eukprot:Sro1664_g289500.1 stable enterotoxin receptor (788) ;mRNA; r:14690-17411